MKKGSGGRVPSRVYPPKAYDSVRKKSYQGDPEGPLPFGLEISRKHKKGENIEDPQKERRWSTFKGRKRISIFLGGEYDVPSKLSRETIVPERSVPDTF